MFTYRSRVIESMPADFVIGSMVARIMVSVRGGPSLARRSLRSKPRNKMLVRLPPSHCGGGLSAISGGAGGRVVWESPCWASGGAGVFFGWLLFYPGGIPGRSVICQQAIILL